MYTLYYQKPYLSIYHHARRNLGKSVWSGFVSGADYKESMLACVELIQSKQVRFWVADNRDMRAIRLKDQLWSNQVLMPKLIKTGLEKLAIVVSNDMFNQLAVDSIIQQAGNNITFEIKYFHSTRKAELWLEQCLLKNSDKQQLQASL